MWICSKCKTKNSSIFHDKCKNCGQPNNRIRNMMIFAGYTFAFGNTILMLWTFITAYLHPSKTVTITIDTMNEANYEWFMILIVFDIILTGLILSFINIKKKTK